MKNEEIKTSIGLSPSSYLPTGEGGGRGPKRIMVLGGNIVQMEATLEAKRQGYYVISADLHEDNPGHKVADEYCKVDIVDKEAVLREAKRLNIDGIVPYSSDTLAPIAAYVAEEMGLPGNPYKAVCTLTHKDLFRKFLRENGFCAPWSDSFTDKEDAIRYFREKKNDSQICKAIMKPVDSAGSRGVFAITSEEELAEHWAESLSYSICKKVIIEQFVEKVGHQLDGDIFLDNGKIIFAGFCDQHHVIGKSALVPVSLSTPSELSQEMKQKAVDELQRLFSLLGMKTGPCNVEFVVGKDGGIYFLDLGPRNGGCNIPYLEQQATGFEENLYTIRAAVGDELPKRDNVLCNSTNYVMYYRPYANENGRYKELWMSDYFRDKVINITHLMNIGDDIQLTHNGNDTVAVVFAKFDNQQEMLDTIDNMSEHLRVITEHYYPHLFDNAPKGQ